MVACCILANVPAWIQALAAVCLVILTLLTLIVLKGYAADTNTIAQASVSQLENSQMPFLAVAFGDQEGGGWGIYNQGFGPAINISYSRYDRERREMFPIPPIAPGRRQIVHNEYAHAVGNPAGFEIQYESLSGAKYRTLISWDEQGTARVQFQKPIH
ncbi:MAG: hypothetical protein DMG77_00775 [Acidobacteria bacterium]|nr:MAG: hypothetical protein DMG77_00775 [Acidobacteriota bacterium]